MTICSDGSNIHLINGPCPAGMWPAGQQPPAGTQPATTSPGAPAAQQQVQAASQSAVGSAVGDLIPPVLKNPATWKSLAIVAVAVLLIGSGVILMAFGQIAGVENRAVKA